VLASAAFDLLSSRDVFFAFLATSIFPQFSVLVLIVACPPFSPYSQIRSAESIGLVKECILSSTGSS